MFEVDVFEHPRFCDEFSHLMNRSFLACASLFSESHLHPIDCCHLFKDLEDHQTYCIALKENFEQIKECLK